jgi:tripartite-type tricarboxylate transporter receptor subunit TctC
VKLSRRKCLRLAAAAAPLPAICRTARAQAYPSRPVRIVVGQSAGSGTDTDTAARLLGQWLSNRFGQPFIVENLPGAGGNLAAAAVARAPADGHTLLTAIVANARRRRGFSARSDAWTIALA